MPFEAGWSIRRMNVKKDKSKKKSKSGGDDDLRKMRERHQRLKERSENPGGGGGEKRFDELKVGKNLRRVLPRLVDGKINPQFYTESLMHFKVGPNQWTVRCIGDKFIDKKSGRPTPGTPCPICKKFLKEQDRVNSEYGKGDEEGKHEWKKAKEAYCPRVRYYFNVIDGEGEVKLHSCGDQIMEQLLGYFFEDDSDVGDFTAVDGGSWMNFKRIGDGRNTKYKVFPGDPAPIEDQWDTVKDMLHDLEAAKGEVRTAEQIVNIMKGVKEEDDESDDSSDDEEEEEDEDEEQEDDESEEEAEDDDEDDEDERPIKSSKLSKKMKSKLKKKSRR